MFFQSKKTVLGVDIGTSNIKIAEISFADPASAVLATCGVVNSPYQLSDKNDRSSIAQIAGILKNLCLKAGVSTKRCIISLPNSAVFTSVVELPQMSHKELSSAVYF